MIGAKLKVARSASGMSLRALADFMGVIVSAQAIGNYADNDIQTSGTIALAKALSVSEEYLLSEDSLSLEGVDFRKKVGTSVREEAALEARAIHMLERYLAIKPFSICEAYDWDAAPKRAHTCCSRQARC